MATMDVQLPDGTVIQGVPEGITKAELVSRLQRNGMAVPSEWLAQAPEKSPDRAAVERVGALIRGIPRQFGLAARYGLEGAGQAAEIVTEPIRQLVVNPLARAAQPTGLSDLITGRRPVVAASTGRAAANLADWMGLPQPADANERVIGDASRTVASAMTLGGGARALADQATGMTQAGLQALGANMGLQSLGAAGAGAAGGAVREAGGSPLEQAGAAMLGGVLTPMAAGGARAVAEKGARAIVNRISPLQPQEVDQQIALVLRGTGVDWSTVPPQIKAGMRREVADALATGRTLDPDALRRLVDFRAVGATPTRGMLTQDPVQITRERNLAKVAANSADSSLQRLPNIEHRNTQRLLDALDDAGARNAPDTYATGESLLGALGSRAAQKKAEISGLYNAARSSDGRSAPLNGAAFTAQANQALDEALLGYAVPPSVAEHLNRIAKGEVPFTVDYAEQLKTAMGDIARADKGGATAKAMSVIRKALDSAPLADAPTVNPGNLPAVAGTVPTSPGVLGQDAIGAFNKARAANASWMRQIEGTPALQAALDGADPDQFVKRFVIGQGASANDVRALQQAVASDPAALQAVKQNIVAHLKSAATNGTEDVTKFSSAGYRKALEGIGERKLAALGFTPEEIAQLESIKRVGTLMQSQPAGSAVNNSNSGALLIGRALDVLDSIAGKLPLGLDTMIQGTIRGTQQWRATSVPSSLLAPRQGTAVPPLPPALLGGLLATQPIDYRQ